MSQSTLAQLRNFSHAEIKALAMAGLVLLAEINAGRLVVCGLVETDPRRNAELIADTTALVEYGYALQQAIHSADDEALPELIRAFAAIADGEVRHG